MPTWITIEDLGEGLTTEELEMAPMAIKAANEILFRLTGEKFEGRHTVTEYYSRDLNGSLTCYAPQAIDGKIYNLPTGERGCPKIVRELPLRMRPAREVHEVKEMGKILGSEAYSIRDRAYLVKENRTGWMIETQDAVEVTYTYGTSPPEMGKLAAVRLANEFIWSSLGDDRCSLPERVMSVNRQNVSYTILDPQEYIGKGLVGIPFVDTFIKAYNPSGAQKKARVFKPSSIRTERKN